MAIKKRLGGLLAGFVFYALSASFAHAVVITEIGDTEEFVGIAQDTPGDLEVDSIKGNVTNLRTVTDPLDDADLYTIFLTDPASFP